MAFIIQQEIKTKNSTRRHYFQERIGIINSMTDSQNHAHQYATNLEAQTDRTKYFGNRPGIKVITHVIGTDRSEPGVIVIGHESGIF